MSFHAPAPVFRELSRSPVNWAENIPSTSPQKRNNTCVQLIDDRSTTDATTTTGGNTPTSTASCAEARSCLQTQKERGSTGAICDTNYSFPVDSKIKTRQSKKTCRKCKKTDSATLAQHLKATVCCACGQSHLPRSCCLKKSLELDDEALHWRMCVQCVLKLTSKDSLGRRRPKVVTQDVSKKDTPAGNVGDVKESKGSAPPALSQNITCPQAEEKADEEQEHATPPEASELPLLPPLTLGVEADCNVENEVGGASSNRSTMPTTPEGHVEPFFAGVSTKDPHANDVSDGKEISNAPSLTSLTAGNEVDNNVQNAVGGESANTNTVPITPEDHGGEASRTVDDSDDSTKDEGGRVEEAVDPTHGPPSAEATVPVPPVVQIVDEPVPVADLDRAATSASIAGEDRDEQPLTEGEDEMRRRRDFDAGYRRCMLHCGLAAVGIGLVGAACWAIGGRPSRR